MEQFIDSKRYKVIPRTLIFSFHNDEVLLIKKKDISKWGGKLNVPGGHIEPGEDILESAKRELMEETGLSDIELIYLGNVMIDVREDTGITLHIFKGITETKKIISSDEGELFWVKVDEINDFPVLEDIFDLLPLVYKWRKGDLMIVGHLDRNGHRYYQKG